jgi:hypothetical protein
MKNNHFFFLVVGMLQIFFIAPARATDYFLNETIDLSSPDTSTSGQDQIDEFALPGAATAFNLSSGDSITGTITFDQTLTVTNDLAEKYVVTLLFDTDAGPPGTSNSAAILLRGVSGDVSDTYLQGFISGPVAIEGFQLTGSTVSFTGISYAFVDTSAAPVESFNPDELVVEGTSISVAAAPEPSTWVMLLMSFGLFAFFGRKILSVSGLGHGNRHFNVGVDEILVQRE